MAKKVIQNIVGQTSNYDLAKISLSYTQNMYEETVNATESSTTKILRSISGIVPSIIRRRVIEGSLTVRGMYFTSETKWAGRQVLYIVLGNRLYLVVNNDFYKICDLAAGTNTVNFAECQSNGVFGKYMAFTDGENCYAVNIDEYPYAQRNHVVQIRLPERINDTQSIKPTHIAYLYGYLVVNDSNSDFFYVSYQYPFTRFRTGTREVDLDIFEVGSDTWGVKGHYTLAEWQPDNITALCSNSSRLFVFGRKSYQIFQYTNDINNPFSSPDTAAKKIGLMDPESLSQLGEYTCWLGSSDMGNMCVFMNMNGSTESTRISNYAIEEQLRSASSLEGLTSTMFQERGHIFYLLSIPALKTTLCYDITEQSWCNRVSYDNSNVPGTWRYKKVVADDYGKLYTAWISPNVDQFGNHPVLLGTLETNSNLDLPDLPLVRIRRGGIISNSNRNFYIDEISLQLSDGKATWPEIDKPHGKIGLSYSVDGATWSGREIVEVGGQGEYDYDCTWYNFGIGKYFSLEIVCSDDMPFAIYGMNLNYSECPY